MILLHSTFQCVGNMDRKIWRKCRATILTHWLRKKSFLYEGTHSLANTFHWTSLCDIASPVLAERNATGKLSTAPPVCAIITREHHVMSLRI